ncbi:MAG: substrate-binding domain-containing protein, partial [Lentisphaeria bacterium]|nr:substrate-binding domain-containing protein [Lentisphaeria bacterium]
GYDEAGQELFLTAQDSYYRLVAMRQALSEARIPFSFNNCFEVPFEPGNTDRILQQLIDENRMPTAFVCFDDVVAVLLLESLTALGLEVPKDVSVLGFGDVVEGIDLATATIDTNDMAELAVARIRERISQGGLGGMTLSVTSAFKPGGSIGPVKTTK